MPTKRRFMLVPLTTNAEGAFVPDYAGSDWLNIFNDGAMCCLIARVDEAEPITLGKGIVCDLYDGETDFRADPVDAGTLTYLENWLIAKGYGAETGMLAGITDRQALINVLSVFIGIDKEILRTGFDIHL